MHHKVQLFVSSISPERSSGKSKQALGVCMKHKKQIAGMENAKTYLSLTYFVSISYPSSARAIAAIVTYLLRKYFIPQLRQGQSELRSGNSVPLSNNYYIATANWGSPQGLAKLPYPWAPATITFGSKWGKQKTNSWQAKVVKQKGKRCGCIPRRYHISTRSEVNY